MNAFITTITLEHVHPYCPSCGTRYDPIVKRASVHCEVCSWHGPYASLLICIDADTARKQFEIALSAVRRNYIDPPQPPK